MGLFRPVISTRRTQPMAETTDRDHGTSASPRQWLIERLGGQMTPAGARISADSVEGIDTAYSCIGVLAETAGQTPVKVLESLPNGSRLERPDTLEYQLLHEQPNPECHAPQFFQCLTRQAASRGQAFAEIQRNSFGEPIALWPLLSSHMQVDRDERRYLRYSYTLPDGRPITWVREPGRPSPILHFAINSTDGITGRSPVKLLADTLGWAKATEEFGARFFANNATPSTVVSYPTRLKPKTKEALRQSWEEKFSGLSNAHRLAILEEGMKLEKIGIPPNEAQFLETMRFQVEKICRIYRVPPFMVGHTEKTTCLPADAFVATPQGARRVHEITPGTLVWSLDEQDGVFKASRVANLVKTGYDRVFTIKTTARTLRVNGAHRVLVRRKFAAPRPGAARASTWRNVWIHARELQVQDILFAPRRLSSMGGRVAPNGRAVTIGFMEFAGLYVGNGSSTRQATGVPAAVSIARDAKAPHFDHYRAVMTAEFEAYAPGFGSGDDRTRREIALQESERATKFASTLAAKELIELGLTGTAHTKRLPAWIFGLDEDLQLAFLRGYLDSDGAVHARGWITYGSCNEDLLADVQQLCWHVGIPTGDIQHLRPRGTVEIGGRVSQRGDMYHLCLYDADANRRIGSHNPTKLARLAAAPVPTRKTRNHPDYVGRGVKGSRPGDDQPLRSCVMQRVTAIDQDAIEQPVYDIAVEDTHTFVANGLVVHNSWGSGIGDMQVGFVTFTMMWWFVNWVATLKRDLFGAARGRTLQPMFVINALLRGDVEKRFKAYQVGRQIGMYTANDLLRLEDMNPRTDADGDTYWEQAGVAAAVTEREAA